MCIQWWISHPEWGTTYAERPLLFHNLKNGKFELVPAVEGTGLAVVVVGRGVAFGDLFNDGKIDAVMNNMDGVPVLLRNVNPDHHHWVELKLVGGPKSPRDAVGATVYLTAGGMRQRGDVLSGGSYLSSNDPRVHFGLGGRGEGGWGGDSVAGWGGGKGSGAWGGSDFHCGRRQGDYGNSQPRQALRSIDAALRACVGLPRQKRSPLDLFPGLKPGDFYRDAPCRLKRDRAVLILTEKCRSIRLALQISRQGHEFVRHPDALLQSGDLGFGDEQGSEVAPVGVEEEELEEGGDNAGAHGRWGEEKSEEQDVDADRAQKHEAERDESA